MKRQQHDGAAPPPGTRRPRNTAPRGCGPAACDRPPDPCPPGNRADRPIAPGSPLSHPLAADLDHVLAHTAPLWERLRGQRIFVTGGTGFFGVWFLESFAWANARLQLGASLVALTRDAQAARQRLAPLSEGGAIRFHEGDVRNFDFPQGEFPYIVHAAAISAAATFHGEDPLVRFDTIVDGTRRTLDFAARCRCRDLLFVSSGIAYGRQPSTIERLGEDYPGAPSPADPNAAYGEAKRAAELLCALHAKRAGFAAKIARCFSFVGPHLPLDLHYAVGNFIRDGLRGGPIVVDGDGTPYRSYLYAADLVIWLLTLLVDGEAGETYNVGSGEAITIGELAGLVRGCFAPSPQIVVRRRPPSGALPDRYVPSVEKAESRAGLVVRIGLREAIRRTVAFHANTTPTPHAEGERTTWIRTR